MKRGTGFLLLALLLAGSGGPVPPASATTPGAVVMPVPEPGHPVELRIPAGPDGLQRAEVRLQSLLYPWLRSWIPVRALGLVNPRAKQTLRGVHLASVANREGRRGRPNRRFYSRPRIACAAFVSWCLRQVGWRWTSNSAQGLYNLLRAHGGKLVAAKVSTRYTPFFSYMKAGDVIAFWKGSRRIGHVEIYIGGGMTVGTSSSALHVGIRRVGNRGFARMSVIRI
jgi:NlpC/P60 family